MSLWHVENTCSLYSLTFPVEPGHRSGFPVKISTSSVEFKDFKDFENFKDLKDVFQYWKICGRFENENEVGDLKDENDEEWGKCGG